MRITARHDGTRDGGRKKEDVDPSKFSNPKGNGGKHSKDDGKGGKQK